MALDKDLNVNVTADATKFERGMRSAAASARVMERELKKQEAAAARFKEQTGRAMIGAGAAVLAGVGLSVKAAAEWESAWAGVTKTVDGNAKQMAELEGQLRAMARELPATHTEIAAVAEAAGQLGVQRENIVGFTRTMIDLGETTNLSADQAATSLARFSNIMGTNQSDVDRLGAVLVDLGNNAATTEAEILELGTRLAAAGKIAGLSEADVFAFASTLTSVGVRAEAGGTALSKVFTKIRDSVLDGGEELEIFAEVAGTSAKKFARDFNRDPAQAIASFIAGLGRMNEAGQSTTKVFEDLSLTDQRLMRALLSTAGAGELLTDQLALGNKAWADNSALVEEAAKRYETTESKMKIAKNNITDLGISIGEGLLPALGGMAEKLSGFVQALDSLPAPVKGSLGVLGLLVGTMSAVGGAALLMVPKIHTARATMETMGGAAAKFNKGLGAVGRFLTGPWGIALGVATVAAGAWAASRASLTSSADEWLDLLADEIDLTKLAAGAYDNLAAATQKQVAEKLLRDHEDLLPALEETGVSLGDIARVLLGDTGPAYDRVQAAIKDYTAEVSRGRDGQTALIGSGQILKRVLGEEGEALELTRREQAQLNKATDEGGEATENLTPKQKKLAEQFNLTAEDAASAEEEIAELDKTIDALFEALFGVEKANDKFHESLQALRKQVKGNIKEEVAHARSLKGNSEAARENRSRMRDLVEAGAELLQKEREQGASKKRLTKLTEAIIGKVRNEGKELGLTKKDVERYTGAIDKSADEVSDFPELKPKANVDPALNRLKFFKDNANRLLNDISDQTVTIDAKVQADFVSAKQRLNRATGGILPGPPSDADNMVINAASGEYVVNARQTSKHLALLEAINAGRLPAFADGGLVNLDLKARGSMGSTIPDIMDAIQGFAQENWTSLMPTGGGGVGGAGVERWRGVAMQALALAGSPLSWIDSLLRRMNQESGGNPRAINLWDSNAAAGIPSKGLMQTIDPTFNAYAGFLRGRGVWDPLANIFASINYANARYGAAPIGWNQPGGYASGGQLPGSASSRDNMVVRAASGEYIVNARSTAKFLPLLEAINSGKLQGFAKGGMVRAEDGSMVPKSFYGKRSAKPERILSPRQTKAFERLVETLQGAPSGSTSGRQLAKAIDALVVVLRQEGKPGLASRLGGPFESRMAKMFARRERLDERIERAANRRDRASGRRSDLVSGVRGNILAERDLASFSANGPRDVREILEENLRRVRRFQRRLRRLTRMGFRKEIVSQIAKAGPEAGAAMAQALSKAGPKQVAGINKQFRDIGKVSKRFSREMGNELFGAGVQMSKGLLRGLRKNRRALRREMRSLGRSMVKDIRSELKISSPSKEMDWTGEMAAKGLLGGWGRELSGSWFDVKGPALKQVIPQVAPMRTQDRSVRVAIDYDRLGESVARAMNRSGSRQLKVSGRMSIDAGRNGGLVGIMRDVAADEARDEADWRRN